jgi:mutator protein MutT
VTLGNKIVDVVAAIIEKDGLVLATRRKNGMHLAGLWEFPGGKLEPGETPEVALRRELKEEFAVDSQIGTFFGENIHDYGDKVIRLLAYRVTHLSGEFQLTDHDEIRWLKPEDLDDLAWAPADVPIKRKYQLQQEILK